MRKTWISLLSILLLLSMSLGVALADVHPSQMGDVGGYLTNQYTQDNGNGFSQPFSPANTLPQGDNIFYATGDSSTPPWMNASEGAAAISAPPWELESAAGAQTPPWMDGTTNVYANDYAGDPEVGYDANVPYVSNPNSNVIIVPPGSDMNSYTDAGTVGNTGGTTTQATGGVQVLDWYATGFDLINANKNITVRDLKSGVTWNATYINGKNHADVIPASQGDAQKLTANNITGDYVRRPVVVTIGGTQYAGSMYAVGHGDTSYCNYFSGVMCIHFTGSQTHGSKQVDSDHQNAINEALQSGY